MKIKNTYEESTEDMKNPGRGAYEIYTFFADKQFDKEAFDQNMFDIDCLALVRINIGAYKDAEIPRVAVDNIKSILDYFVEKEKDIILRVVYDSDGKGIENEPGLFSKVIAHMITISKIVRDYARYIYIYQGVLIGSWGEMHSSKFLDKVKIQDLNYNLRAAITKCERRPYLAVRTLEYLDMIEKEGASIFDDGILGSATHLGSFHPDKVEESLQRLIDIADKKPYGGEIIWNDDIDVTKVVDYLKKMKVSYLNRYHDEKLIEALKNTPIKKGAWKGKDAFSYIINHLGYRYVVSKSVGVTKGDVIAFEIAVKNWGFSKCYETINVYIEGPEGLSSPDVFLAGLQPGEATKLHIQTKAAKGEYYLIAKRAYDGKSINFGNTKCKDGRLYLGKI